MFTSTKSYGHEIGLSCAFRQWRAQSHCRFLHGYALKVVLTFEAHQTDARGWVVDFGSLKSLKGWLEDTFDHRTLVAFDDPMLERFRQLDHLKMIQLREVPETGCEAFAFVIFQYAEIWMVDNGYAPRVRLASVSVHEHGANSAAYFGGP